MPNLDIQSMNYETAFAALKDVVNQLESQELPLEQSLNLFKWGQQLIQHCTALLDAAEMEITRLVPEQGDQGS